MNGLSLRISSGGINKDSKQNHENKLQAFRFSEPFSIRYHRVENIEDLLEAKNVNEQLEYLRNIAKILDSSSEDVNIIVSLLVNTFLEAPVKHPLKNTAARILSTKKLYLAAIEDELSVELSNKISILCGSTELDEINNVYTILNSCFDNFTPGVGAVKKSVKNILPFLKNSSDNYVTIIRNDSSKLSPTDKLKLFTYIHNLNRALLTIIQKCDVNFHSVDSVEVWGKLSISSAYLIKHGDLPIDTNILCSMIFITISQLRFGATAWKYIFEIIFDVEDHSDHVMYEEVKDLNSPIEILCICSALLNIISPDEMHCQLADGRPALTFMTQKLFELSEKMSVDTTIIIGVARAILSVSRLLFKITNDVCVITDVTKIILSFIWSHLEYYVDSVRHLSTQILVNVVKISLQLENQGDSKLSNEVFSSVMMLPADRHSKYKGLATLSSEYGCTHLLNKYPNIVHDLLKAINNVTIPANVSVAFETLMSEHNKEVTIDVLFETWIMPVMEAMVSYASNDETAVMSMNVLQDVLSKGIKLNPNLVSLMIPYIMSNENSEKLSDGQLECILVCLHVARKAGSFDQDVDKMSNHKWKNIIEYDILRYAVSHQLPEIRLLSFHLIVDTRKTTKMYTPEEFDLIKTFFYYNINVQSPSIRQNILALTKKMLKRWKDSFDVLLRNIDNILKKSIKALQLDVPVSLQNSETDLLNAQNSLKALYISFIENLWSYCLDNIFPGANFSRRNISLQILVWCQDFVKTKQIKFNWSNKAVSALVDYLDDSYECNKQLVVDLLSHCPVEYLQFQDQEYVKTFLSETVMKASSVKPTDCVTSAYKLSLLLQFPEQFRYVLSNSTFDLCGFEVHYHTLVLLMDKLRSEMKGAECNILMAASSGPMYGLLHCVRHVLNQLNFRNISENSEWSSLLFDLVKMSFKVNDIVAPIVNNSSPEGHLPMDFNAGSNHVEGNGVILDDGKRVTAQMVLLCAWRSVKEVSLLLGDISYNVEVIDKSTDNKMVTTISPELILEIGDHFTTLLSETKHRGAFEQAYLGFSMLCLRLWKSNTESLHSLPGVWLQDLITAISGNSENSKLCATRRSAGVPFMVQALVTTELQVSGNPQCFRSCITTLLNLAAFDKGESDKISVETRTHCLNILRALYRHTALGEHVNPYVAEGLMTAITGFDGSTWAERNSSTLLFSSLMTRIFGVQRSKDSDSLCIRNRMTGRIFFLRYPQLYDFILHHLRNVAEHIGDEDFLKPSLYPILLLLARLYPSSLEGTDSNLKLVAYVPYLVACAECCVLKTRQLAAKAMVPLISHDRYFSHMMSLLEILTDWRIKTNHCHGILLQLIRLVQSAPDMCSVPSDFHQQLVLYLDRTKWILTNLANGRPCFVTAESYLHMIYLCVIRFDIVNVGSNFFNEIHKYLEHPMDLNLRIHFGKEKYCVTCLHFSMQLAYERQDADEIFRILKDSKNSPMYEVQSACLSYLLCLQSKSDLKSVCEQFEIGDIERLFVMKLTTDMTNRIVQLLNSSDKSENITSTCHHNLQCQRKQLMSMTYNSDLSEKYWSRSPSQDTSNDERLFYFIQQTHALDNQQIIRFIYLRYLDNHFKKISCKSIYDYYSESAVKYLSRIMYESWTSVDNSVYMHLECVKFLKNHWKIFNWWVDLDNKQRVYSITLQLSSLLQLLDNEDEVVRHVASQVVADIALQYQMGILDRDNHSLCENKAKEVLLQLVSSWSTRISVEFSTFVLMMLALLDDLSFSVDNTNDEEYQVFDKEVTTYQEKVGNTKLCASFIKNNLGEQWILKNNKEKQIYLLNTIQLQSKGVRINKEDFCQASHSTFCLLWKALVSTESSFKNMLNENLLYDMSLNRITAFLDELSIDVNINSKQDEENVDCVENNEDHVYKFMDLKNGDY